MFNRTIRNGHDAFLWFSFQLSLKCQAVTRSRSFASHCYHCAVGNVIGIVFATSKFKQILSTDLKGGRANERMGEGGKGNKKEGG